MKSRLNTMLAGLALTVPFLVPAIGTAEEFEPVVYVSSTTSGNVDGVWFADEDILAYGTESDSWERYFDGSDVGLRYNDVNAFHIADDGTILMALKKPQRVGGFWADDSDVIAFSPTSLGRHTAGTFSKYFDGSDVGLSTWAEEIDALAMTPDGRLLLSTSGSLKVPRTGGGTLWGADEDLIVFNATSLGRHTAGSFERYFDGSDVGLRNSSEDVWGAWVDPFSGDIAITTKSYYKVPGLRGDKEDIIVFSPDSLGYQTTGTFFPGWDGDDHGLSGEYLDGLFVDLGQPSEGQWFQASINGDWVQGWGFSPNHFVTVEIFAPGATEPQFSGPVGTDGEGYFNLEPHVHGVDLEEGTYITVGIKALMMVNVSFDTFDVDNKTIGGTAPVGATVGFGVGNEGGGFDGETVATGGTWFVDLNGIFDLTQDMGGQAWVSDDDGDQTVADGGPPQPPQFQASLTNDWVQGWGFAPNAFVTVDIYDFEGAGNTELFSDSVPTDAEGNFNLYDLQGVDLVAGTYIVVTGSTKTLVMVALSFDEFDVDNDLIGGTAPVGATVEFGVGNEGSGADGQIVATDGTWSVDLSTDPYNFDLAGDMGGQAWVTDNDGDQTIAEPPPPPQPPQFQASLNGDWIQGWGFEPGASVPVEIFDVFEGTSQFGTTVIPDGEGYFNLEPQVHSVNLMEGTYITVGVKALVMVNVTFDTFDIDLETLGGFAPAGETVGFGVGNEGGGFDGETVATGGTWFVDLLGTFNLTDDMGGQAWVSDDDGDQTVADGGPPQPPHFQASLTNDWVQGWNFTPESTVRVQIFESLGGASQFDDVVPTDPGGSFNLEPQEGVDLMDGTYIVVTGSEKTLEMVLVTFDIFDVGLDRIAGTAPVGAVVGFGGGNESRGFEGQITATDGTWSVDLFTAEFNFFDLTPDMGAQAWVSDADGDQTVAEPRFPQFQASLTSDWVQGWNFTPESTVLVEIFESSGAAVPLFFDDVETDLRGNFNLDAGVHGEDLTPDSYIVVTGPEKTLVMVALTFDEFDADANRIAGTAPVGAVVEFGGGNQFAGFGGRTTANASGYWSVNLNTAEFEFFDLTPSMGAQAWVSDADGDQTVADPQVPQFQASLTSDWVQGWNFTPISTVTVEIFEFLVGQTTGPRLFPPGLDPPDPIGTSDDGSFNLDDLQGVDLVAGNYIVVKDSETEKTLLTVALTFENFDVDSDTIGGTALAGAVVDFGVGNEFGGMGGQVVADGSGNWSVNLNTAEYGDFDLTDQMGGQAWVTDADLDQTVAEPAPPET